MRLQFLLLLAAILPVHAEWKRYLSADVEGADSPAPRPLSYFTHEALLRGPGGLGACRDCTPEERAGLEKNGHATVAKIGEVRGLPVYDVGYECSCLKDGFPWPTSKSILVQTGQDEFHEIFYGQGDISHTGGFSETKVLRASEEQTIVWVRVDQGGNRHFMEEYVIRLTSDGPDRVDLDPVLKIANSILPAGGDLFIWSVDLLAGVNKFTFQAPVTGSCPKGAGLPCDVDSIGGTVEVDFRLDGDHVTPLGRRYIP